jgi:hypothetical protein
MPRKILFMWLLLLAGLMLVTCRRDVEFDRDCSEGATIDEIMEWVYFKTGSYWIYQEQNSGQLDTFFVYSDYSAISPSGYQEFYVKMESSLDGYTYKYSFTEAESGECSTAPGCVCRVVWCDKYIPGDYAGGNRVFMFPMRIGQRTVQSGYSLDFGTTKVVDYMETDSIQGFVFDGVFDVHQDYSPQHDYHEALYRIVRGVGVIQKILPVESENWEVVEFHVTQ